MVSARSILRLAPTCGKVCKVPRNLPNAAIHKLANGIGRAILTDFKFDFSGKAEMAQDGRKSGAENAHQRGVSHSKQLSWRSLLDFRGARRLGGSESLRHLNR
jgi:hypothetical protein